jgi:hypothetical protein
MMFDVTSIINNFDNVEVPTATTFSFTSGGLLQVQGKKNIKYLLRCERLQSVTDSFQIRLTFVMAEYASWEI